MNRIVAEKAVADLIATIARNPIKTNSIKVCEELCVLYQKELDKQDIGNISVKIDKNSTKSL